MSTRVEAPGATITKTGRHTLNLDTHRREAQIEDVQYLVDHGTLFDDACRRVGVAPDTVIARIRRG